MVLAPLVLTGFVALATAATTPVVPPFTKTLVAKCMTASGPQSVNLLATSTKAVKLTTTIKSLSTRTPTTTITPDPETEMTVECSTSTITEVCEESSILS